MSNVADILKKFGHDVTRLAKIAVGRTVNGRRIDTTGKLRNSIKYTSDDDDVTFFMEKYGLHVDAGVVGKKKRILKNWNKSVFERGRGYSSKPPPIDTIKKWITQKPIRPRNLTTGQFSKKTPQIINQMAFLISQKIFNYGIQPKLFFSEPFNLKYKTLPNDIIHAFGDDFDELITD